MSDEIIKELWRTKDCMAKKFNYDIDALAAELRKRQKQSGRKAINPKKDSSRQIPEQPR
jgi:hypothetical protein